MAALDNTNTTTRHYLVSDDDSAVVSALGYERSRIQIPATGVSIFLPRFLNEKKIQQYFSSDIYSQQRYNYHAQHFYTSFRMLIGLYSREISNAIFKSTPFYLYKATGT